jgi:hypothetical protein
MVPAVDLGREDPDGLCTEGLDAVGHGVVAIFRSIGDFGDPEVPTVSPPDTAHGLPRSGPGPAPRLATRSTPGDGRFAKQFRKRDGDMTASCPNTVSIRLTPR